MSIVAAAQGPSSIIVGFAFLFTMFAMAVNALWIAVRWLVQRVTRSDKSETNKKGSAE